MKAYGRAYQIVQRKEEGEWKGKIICPNYIIYMIKLLNQNNPYLPKDTSLNV